MSMTQAVQVTNEAIATNGISPVKFLGFKARGRATLAGNPGTIAIVPGPAVAATDMIMIGGSTQAGTPGGKFVLSITAGVAGVGGFTINSTANDQSIVTWLLCDNTFLG
jgi:hypothetical protein